MTAIKEANIKAFDVAMAKFEKLRDAYIERLFSKKAHAYLESAIENWRNDEPALKKDMTGNLITGFMVGLYKDGKCKVVHGASSVSGVKSPSHWMIAPREVTPWIEKGMYEEELMFYDYDTGFEVNEVYPYNEKKHPSWEWQDVPERRWAVDLARTFLFSFTDVPANGWSMVVCNGAPYAGYLLEVRELDVLQGIYNEAKIDFKDSLKQTLNQLAK